MKYDEPEKAVWNRLLAAKGMYNVRDIGGYAAGEGRQVKRGIFYRAGELYHLSGEGKALLESKNIKTIVDFRGKDEMENAPDDVLSSVLHTHQLSIDPGNMTSLSHIEAGVSVEGFMRELYGILVTGARPQYRKFFRILSEPENTPLLFHCSAGKDRTGLAAALLLLALGVDRETVYADYMLSAEYLKDKFAEWCVSSPHLKPVFTIHRDYLDMAFARIEDSCGGTAAYLREELNVDAGLLKRLYTEPADS
jgi:protein-tyrosine phosphatase